MSRRSVALGLTLGLLVAACGTEPSDDEAPSGSVPADGVEVIAADVRRLTSTDVSPEELEAVIEGNTEFAFDLFRAASAPPEDVAEVGNVIVSPFSVAAALTMTYAGARGDTAQQMRDVLHLSLPDDRAHAARNELDLRLGAEPESFPDDDREPFTIRVANSLWGQHGYPFLDEFLEQLAANYEAGMNLIDFAAAAEDARRAINDWVEDQTEGRIVDLIPAGMITDVTRLVLVNAIWFKANWAEQFGPGATAPGSFTLLGGEEATVPLMHSSIRAPMASGDGYTAVRLAYAGDAAMWVVLPDEGSFDAVRSSFGSGDLEGIRSSATERQIDLTMPRFEFRSQLALKPVLQDLGMVDAFADPSLPDGADFTGMTPRRELFVHEVVHQAFITVDEEGTEAAAATAVVVGLTSAVETATMTIDRPFLFLIEHASTGELLFVGQVVDPT